MPLLAVEPVGEAAEETILVDVIGTMVEEVVRGVLLCVIVVTDVL